MEKSNSYVEKYGNSTFYELLIGQFTIAWSQFEVTLRARFEGLFDREQQPFAAQLVYDTYPNRIIQFLKNLYDDNSITIDPLLWAWFVSEFERLRDIRNDLSHGTWAEDMSGNLAAIRHKNGKAPVLKFTDPETIERSIADIGRLNEVALIFLKMEPVEDRPRKWLSNLRARHP